MYPLNRLPRGVRRVGASTVLASFAAFNLLGGGMVPSASAAGNLDVSIASAVAVTEGVDPSADFIVTVNGGNHPNTGITVNYKTIDVSAVDGLDYTGTKTGVLNIPAGINSGTISVPLVDDTTYEPLETFKVKLTGASVNISSDTGIATITSPDPRPRVNIRDAQVTEGDGVLSTKAMLFTVDVDRAANVDYTVDWATVSDTATGGGLLSSNTDFMSAHGTLTFPADSAASQQISVAIKGDTVYEDDEQFFVQLSNPFVALLGRDKATGTIKENEKKPKLSLPISASMDEGNGGSAISVLFFDVTMDQVSDSDVTFTLSTFDGTAHDTNDYNALNKTVTIPAGSTRVRESVTTQGDTRPEDNETFHLSISDPVGANLDNASCEVTILDDD